VIALDSTRVKIRGEDYINANYIDIGGTTAVIACQGPMKSTEYDFWNMVLEGSCPIILMLTDCVEGYRHKCSDYWPAKKEKKTFFSCGLPTGRITVEKLGEEEVEDYRYVVSNLVVVRGDATLEVKHIHYSGWKDYKTPDPQDIRNIISFIERTWVGGHSMICHCSAGIGRTGAMITIMRCIKTGEDPATALRAVRENRHGMVQTKEQYRFILDFIGARSELED
jgi:protein tyrosine phosphatase